MRRVLMLIPLVGALVFGVMLTAQAHNWNGSGDCEGWTLNLDGQWNALEIFVDGQSAGLDLTPTVADDSDTTSRTFVVTWDKAPAGLSPSDVTVSHTLERSGDCTTTTTTTPEDTTTTTQPESSTTTIPEVTTTTPETTTTLPAGTSTVGLIETWFDTTMECQSDGNFTLTVEFGEGMESAYVSLLDPMFPDPVPGDGVTLTPDSPTTGGRLASGGAFEVTGTALPGYEIVGANPVVVLIDNCPEPSIPVDPTSPPATLPFTGIEDSAGLAFAALGLIGMGWLMLRGRRA